MSAPEVALRRLSQTGAGLARCRALLCDAERAEMMRFRREEDRNRFALGRATLREIAGAWLGVAPQRLIVTRDSLGKPGLPEAPALACNVSHSGDLVAVALGAAREIGVDVEAHREGLDFVALARAFMTAAELAALTRAPAPAPFFFRQWCFKEALAKALGSGLTRDPARFEIRFGPEAPRAAFVGAGEDDVGEGWRLEALDVGAGYSGALAWR